MKYYKIQNDIKKEHKNGQTRIGMHTDEPNWLKLLIRDWSVGGRAIVCDQWGEESLIIAPVEIIGHVPGKTEITRAEADLIVKAMRPSYVVPAIYNPRNPIEIVSPEYTVPAGKIEDYENRYLGWAANHTGAIAADETWALVDSPHHLTGTVTVNDTKNLTIEAGCQVLADGNYSLTINGDIIANGTVASWITFDSNALASRGGWVGLIFTNADTATSMTYCKIKNCVDCINVTTNFGAVPTFNHLICEEFTGKFLLGASEITITNSVVRNQSTATWIINVTNGAKYTLTDIEIYNCLGGIYIPGGTTTFTGTRILMHDMGTYNSSVVIDNEYTSPVLNLTDCYVIIKVCGGYGTFLFSQVSATNNTLLRCIATSRYCYINNLISGYSVLTNCDIGPAQSNKKGADTGVTMINCAMAGCNNAQLDNFDTTADGQTTSSETPAQFGTVPAVSGMRSAWNMSATPASIAESGLGDNGVTIGWVTTMITKHRVRYGTVSGTYTMTVVGHESWGDYEGKGATCKVTTTPSLVLVNLKAGVQYYYVVESYDWRIDSWVTSVEGDFTTTSSTVVISNVTIDKTSMTTADSVLVTITTVGTPTVQGVKINGIDFEATGSAGTYTVTIKGSSIGTGTAMAVVGYATSTGGGIALASASTLTITQSAYTNYIYTFLQDLQALLRSEFANTPILIGARSELPSAPCIVLEVATKKTDQETTLGTKEFEVPVEIMVYNYSDEEEQAIKLVGDMAEQLEELLIDNVQNPAGDGSKWYRSKANGVEYGNVLKNGQYLRACKFNYTFYKRVNK